MYVVLVSTSHRRARFQILIVMKILMSHLWVMLPRREVGGYQRFGGTYCVHPQTKLVVLVSGKMFSYTLVPTSRHTHQVLTVRHCRAAQISAFRAWTRWLSISCEALPHLPVCHLLQAPEVTLLQSVLSWVKLPINPPLTSTSWPFFLPPLPTPTAMRVGYDAALP